MLRNQFHAHFDPRYFLDPALLEHNLALTWSDLTEVRDVVEDILNRYSVAFDGDRFVFEPLNQFDIEHVMEALRLYAEK